MKNIIITGTSRGIGYEMVAILAQAGHNVLALSRNAAPVSGLEITNCHCFSCDITDPDAIKKVPLFLKEKGWKHVDVLINNSGYLVNKPFSELSLEDFKRSYDVNVFGPGLAAYSSSKGALITLTELLAEEFKQTGPSFNVLALGAVQTEMLEEAFPGYKAPLTARQMAQYIIDFSLTGNTFYNGKVLEVSSSTP